MTDPSAPTLYCSFCGKNQHEVSKLVAGPAALICDECIQHCESLTFPSDVNVSRSLLKAAIHGCRLLAELRWHDRLNSRGIEVWLNLESAIEGYALSRAAAGAVVSIKDEPNEGSPA